MDGDPRADRQALAQLRYTTCQADVRHFLRLPDVVCKVVFADGVGPRAQQQMQHRLFFGGQQQGHTAQAYCSALLSKQRTCRGAVSQRCARRGHDFIKIASGHRTINNDHFGRCRRSSNYVVEEGLAAHQLFFTSPANQLL